MHAPNKETCYTMCLAWPHPVPQEREGVWVTCFTAVCCATLYSAGPITAQYLVITRCKSTGKPYAAALSVF